MPIAPLSHRSRGSARPQKENEFFRRWKSAVRLFFRLSRREGIARRDFSRAHSLGSSPFFHSLVRVARRSRRSAAAPSAADLTSRSLVYQRGSARDVSRPVVNKSIALLSHKAARSTCGTFITERGGEPGERASGDRGRWSEEGRDEVLSTVQNREERPATRNGGAVSSSILSAARSERLFLLETRSSRTDRHATCNVHQDTSFLLSFG